MAEASGPDARRGGAPVVTAPAEIDIGTAGELKSAIEAARAEGPGAVVLDLRETVYCDSAGLRVLVGAHRSLTAEGRQLRLAAADLTLLRIFTITGTDKLFHLFATVPEAEDGAAPAGGRL
jgi:anti-sigma B factor antagonist